MEPDALAPYEAALRTAAPLTLRTVTGRSLRFDVARWLAPVDAADATVLDRCAGPVLDVGCGPGRFVASLTARGAVALGVDIAETAVALTRGQGSPALLRSVFADLPGEGRWSTVLLVDGNIGIGGDPVRLLHRVAALLAPTGRVLVETAPDNTADERLSVRFTEQGDEVGPEFAWALVGAAALERYAADCGYAVAESWSSGGRTFVALSR
ncbi:Methyltransferase domain-containing protein [Jatrophihabitans endophyticus]|uniref:Methyltransferase domain-containing protein n=1 Tax=Jatrophihabitans endophyticus TaxID=1206085 RepID=A0A1M5UEE6_9ACTN|nr:methyltransferase domain-containing protein [Jatrophihabitans endophyticus]SHH61033.1 Methyltransferase domain-containing protein [Jatrophihabitans endophyticus]